MTYEDWLKSVPENLKLAALWQFKVHPRTLLDEIISALVGAAAYQKRQPKRKS
ncbi:MAG: hypothetical protein HY870_11825 [Chloroflexi bacterium]|nr:hypothetical protein [Chloroflexota bacterium]